MTRNFDVFVGMRLNKWWANNRNAGDLIRLVAYFDVTVMCNPRPFSSSFIAMVYAIAWFIGPCCNRTRLRPGNHSMQIMEYIMIEQPNNVNISVHLSTRCGHRSVLEHGLPWQPSSRCNIFQHILLIDDQNQHCILQGIKTLTIQYNFQRFI